MASPTFDVGSCAGELFELDRHEPAATECWNAQTAWQTIRAIVRDVEDRFDPDSAAWQAHPVYHQVPAKDSALYAGAANPAWWTYSLYCGSAGVILGLEYLRKNAAVALSRDYSKMLADVERNLERLGGANDLSYLVGICGVLLVRWRLEGLPSARERLLEVIAANMGNPTLEFFWGCAGSLLAASFLHETEPCAKLRTLMQRGIQSLMDDWRFEPAFGCHLWTQFFDGHHVKHIGAAHGLAGNVFAMRRSIAALGPGHENMLQEMDGRYVVALEETGAFFGNTLANWPQSVGPPRPGRTAMLVQWCHGAPGIIGASRNHLIAANPSLESMLVSAGELVWQAGPLRKTLGGLCHGTAGNGFALLNLYARTGDTKWLQRARAFAMACIEQYSRSYAQYGQSKCSLFTGDVGVAVFIYACLRRSDAMLGIDTL